MCNDAREILCIDSRSPWYFRTQIEVGISVLSVSKEVSKRFVPPLGLYPYSLIYYPGTSQYAIQQIGWSSSNGWLLKYHPLRQPGKASGKQLIGQIHQE